MRDLAARIAWEIRAGRPLSALEPELDRLEDLLLEAGYATGLSHTRSPYTAVPGLGDGHPVLEVLACPAERCSRVEAPTSAVPSCPVLQRPLRRVVLGS